MYIVRHLCYVLDRQQVVTGHLELRTLGTHYHPTLDPAVLWTPLNDTSRPICSDSLNLTPPMPLYLQTLWRYTNVVIIIIIIIITNIQYVNLSESVNK